jgi:hypothetical protein
MRGRGRPRSGGVAATRTLPRDIASFTGRAHELAALAEAAAGGGGVVSIHAIGGMAGVGKTAFAVHAAHRLADRFPGGQIPADLEARTGLWRDRLAGRLLLVLDDAADSEQVRPLLPGAAAAWCWSPAGGG